MIKRLSKIQWEPLAIILPVVSLFRFPADSLRLMFRVLFEGGVVVLFAGALWKYNKTIAAFLLASFLMLWFPQYDKMSYLAFQAVFYGLIWYWLTIKVVNVNAVYNAICLVGLANVAMIIVQFFYLDPLYTPLSDAGRCTGLMSNQNETGALLAFCFPAFLRKSWLKCLPAIIIGLILAKSSGGMLAIGAVVIFWMLINNMRKQAVLLVAVVSGYMVIDGPTIDQRLDAWTVGLNLFTQQPLGAGIGHWAAVFSVVELETTQSRFLQAHNEYVQLIFEFGVLGICLLVSYFRYFFKSVKTLLGYNKSDFIPAFGVVSLMVNCFVNFPMHIATTAMLGVTWLSLFDSQILKIGPGTVKKMEG